VVEIATSADFFTTLRSLIDQWCDRRCLKALSRILPAYMGFNGLTDGWAALHEAMVNVRAFAGEELSETDRDTLSALIAAAHRPIYRIPPER